MAVIAGKVKELEEALEVGPGHSSLVTASIILLFLIFCYSYG
jgi:hypothetical protein